MHGPTSTVAGDTQRKRADAGNPLANSSVVQLMTTHYRAKEYLERAKQARMWLRHWSTSDRAGV